MGNVLVVVGGLSLASAHAGRWTRLSNLREIAPLSLPPESRLQRDLQRIDQLLSHDTLRHTCSRGATQAST